MASIRSKLWQYFLNPLYSKNSRIGSQLNIKLSRLVEAPFPPGFISKTHRVMTSQEQGHNIFTIIPKSQDKLNNKIIIYLHGGAYVTGITGPHWRFINKLVIKTNIKTAVIDYPIAPEHNYQHVYNMLIPYYRKLLKDYLPSNIILMGDSAGGGLAIALAQQLSKIKLPSPAFMILLSPWLDVTLSNPDLDDYQKRDKLLSRQALITAGKYYANGDDTTNPLISPVYGNFDGLPDIYLFMGNSDILVADAKLLGQKIKNAKVNYKYYEFDNMFHVWMFYPIPEARKAMEKIIQIIDSYN